MCLSRFEFGLCNKRAKKMGGNYNRERVSEELRFDSVKLCELNHNLTENMINNSSKGLRHQRLILMTVILVLVLEPFLTPSLYHENKSSPESTTWNN